MREHFTPGAEGLEEDVGQLRVLGHQLAEARGRDPVHATVLDDAGNQIDRLAGQQVELAEKRAWTEAHERLLRRVPCCRLDDLDRRVLDDDQVVGCVAGAVENLTGLDRLRRSVGAQARELSIAQPRKRNRISDLVFGLDRRLQRHPGLPLSAQRWKRSTVRWGHAPSQGMVPAWRRARMASACWLTSSYDQRSKGELHRFAVALAEQGLDVGLEAQGLVGNVMAG